MKAALVAKVGSLFGGGKLKVLETDNSVLQNEIAIRDESIEMSRVQIQRQQEEHKRQLIEQQAKHHKEILDKDMVYQKETSLLKSVISKASIWFPCFREMLRMENFCLKAGFNER
ncbi:hypothetical protein [Phocaeicola sp.]|uniref:hypothetical protein n=1 Tax=Phocaeicola sp. TaxID=2773926 RepID=UPI003AB2DDEE